MHAKAYYGLARIAILERDPENADRFFRKVLELDPDAATKAWALVYVGKLADSQGGQWRLLSRLGDYAVAGGECGADLADKDRQRKIPGRDANERAAAPVGELVRFPGRAGHPPRAEAVAQLGRVVAAEIRRFAHFGNRILEGLAGFALQ